MNDWAKRSKELTWTLDAALKENERLRDALEEAREHQRLLSREFSHRAANNLQLVAASVNGRLRRTKDPAVRRFGLDILGQLQALAKFHRYLMLAHGDVEMAEYLRGLCAELAAIFGAPNVVMRVEAAPVEVSVDAAVSLGLITTELVTNAYKHAFTHRDGGSVRVQLQPGRDDFVLSVADDGDGFPAEVAADAAGLRTVTLLAQRLGARLDRSTGPGAAISIRMQRAAA